MEREVPTRSWHPRDDDDYEAANGELKKRFAAWVADEGIEVDPESAELMLHYKWNYLDGHLTRWTRDNLNQLYLEVFPAKVMVEKDDLGREMEEARAFLRFLSTTGLLDEKSASIDALIEHIGHIEPEFRKNMADPSLFSMGKRLWTQAAAEGVRPDDPEAVQAFIQRFNARPFAERDAVLGPPLAAMRTSFGRATPPGTRPRPPSARRRKRRR
jgi:hypothetical protein